MSDEERTTAKWIERKVGDYEVMVILQSCKCSNCGKYHSTPYLYRYSHYKYCPHCGAKMES